MKEPRKRDRRVRRGKKHPLHPLSILNVSKWSKSPPKTVLPVPMRKRERERERERMNLVASTGWASEVKDHYCKGTTGEREIEEPLPLPGTDGLWVAKLHSSIQCTLSRFKSLESPHLANKSVVLTLLSRFFHSFCLPFFHFRCTSTPSSSPK